MKDRTYSRQTIWHGALILTVAGLLSKVLSVVYRIPFQNIAGDIGFYIYQQVYPIYGIALALSLYGFPVAISRMVSGRSSTVQSLVMKHALVYLMGIGLVLFIGLYAGAELVASWMGDEKLALPLRTVSVSFLIMPFLSVYRGYFQGAGDMVPTAVSQVLDQSIRVMLILLLTYLFMSRGYSPYIASTAAVLGSVAGGFFALSALLYFRYKRGASRSGNEDNNTLISRKEVGSTLFTHGIAISISSLMLVVFQFIDSMTVLKLLVDSGMDAEYAKGWKGVFDRGQPLLQLGTVFATSLSLTIVPFISNAFKKGMQEEINERVRLAVKVSGIIGVGASLGLVLIMEPTNRMLFQDASGTDVLRVFSLSILFSSLTMTLSAVMQGMGMTMYPVTILFLGLVMKGALNLLLVPVFGTMGAAIATVGGFLTMTVLSFAVLKMRVKSAMFFTRKWIILLYAATGMAVVLIVYHVIFSMVFASDTSRVIAALQALSSVVLGGAVYVVIILKRDLFTQEELAILPVVNKWSMLVKKRMRGDGK